MFVENRTNTCSWLTPSRPSTHVSTISSVAPAPVGAPFAMLTLGAAARSFLAPATPSCTHRRLVPSNWSEMHGSVTRPIALGRDQLAPPFVDVTMKWVPTGSPTGPARRVNSS